MSGPENPSVSPVPVDEARALSRCGYTIVDRDGIEQPCDRPTTGWRWYQDVEHEDMLDQACPAHSNEGGRRLSEADAEVERLRRELNEARAETSKVAIRLGVERDNERAHRRNAEANLASARSEIATLRKAVEAVLAELDGADEEISGRGFVASYVRDTAAVIADAIRAALAAVPGSRGLACCGHEGERHGPEAGGCIECRCTRVPGSPETEETQR